MDNIEFTECGIELTKNKRFIPYIAITEISGCYEYEKNNFIFDNDLQINHKDTTYVKSWYFEIHTTAQEQSIYKVWSDFISMPANIYKPAKFKDIFKKNETYPTFVDWLFGIKYITNPDIENFNIIYKNELEESHSKLNNLRNKLISEYSKAITKYFTLPPF